MKMVGIDVSSPQVDIRPKSIGLVTGSTLKYEGKMYRHVQCQQSVESELQ